MRTCFCYPSDIQLSKITNYVCHQHTRLNRSSYYAAPGITLRRPIGRRRSTEACAGRGNSLPYPEWRTAETSGRPVWPRSPVHTGILTGVECNGCHLLISVTAPTFSLRKEVIQPQVLLRLPCYDFTPIMSHTLGRSSPCGSGRRLLVQPTFVM